MPHMTVHVPEAQLAGREPTLIAALTGAVVEVYGEWAREHVVIRLDGVPEGRWAIGGRAVEDAASAVTFGIQEAAFTRPDAKDVLARLVTALTDALTSVLGEQAHDAISIEFVATPPGRTAHAGVIAE
jgi:phenylpyruvate tautomerase PptA (4-oxalocrotonate tautomerase family)